MKCTDCKYSEYLKLNNTWFCNANKKRPKRIDHLEVELDVPCRNGFLREKEAVNDKSWDRECKKMSKDVDRESVNLNGLDVKFDVERIQK